MTNFKNNRNISYFIETDNTNNALDFSSNKNSKSSFAVEQNISWYNDQERNSFDYLDYSTSSTANF